MNARDTGRDVPQAPPTVGWARASESLFSLISARSRLVAATSVLAGLVAGASSAGLIAVLNTSLNRPALHRSVLIAGFAGLAIIKIVTQATARLLLNRFAQETLSVLCRDLSRQILATPLSHLEHMGIPSILTTLTDDVAWLGWTAQNVPGLVTNTAIVAGCAIYLGWLSWRMMLLVAVTVVIGMIGYRILTTRAYRSLQKARDMRGVLFQHFRTLTEGMKELKLHAVRREAFLTERIEVAAEDTRRHSFVGTSHHIVADTWSQILFYGLLGGLIFALPAASRYDVETVTGYLLVTLYMMAPVWGILEVWPILVRARIALEKVGELGVSLGEGSAESGAVAMLKAPSEWRRIDVDDAQFSYPPDLEGRAFVLGPLVLTFNRGELVFLVGGNGTGKSTFVKLLTGLYSPQMGEIRLDGVPITDKNREWYCQHFSAVFSDFYVFDSLLGLRGADLEVRARRYLVELELDAKVQIKDGALSTTALSQGQRKRLALLTAFLEDRPIYVFDEWAADQDAHYREIFYKRLLPELKARGKTILVISHDDSYYHLADRIEKLDNGKLVVGLRPQA